MKTITVVGAAILDGTKVLAAQRSIDMNSPLKWEFPGGKVEDGETHQKALERELFEELSVRIKAEDFLGQGVSDIDETRIELNVYFASIIQGQPSAREHAGIRWIEIDSIGELEWAEPDIPVCKELMRKFGSICWTYNIFN